MLREVGVSFRFAGLVLGDEEALELLLFGRLLVRVLPLDRHAPRL